MGSKKELFEVEHEFGAFYTGGLVACTNDAKFMISCSGSVLNVISIDKNAIDRVIGKNEDKDNGLEDDVIYTFALSKDEVNVVTAHKSGLLKMWNFLDGALNKTWKGNHNGPIARLNFRSDSILLASGGSDGTVRIWEPSKSVCEGSLRGCTGVIGVLLFHPDPKNTLLLASGDDNKIIIWDYAKKEIKYTLGSHFSKVTSVDFSPMNSNQLISAGRDKVVILWTFSNGSVEEKVVPVGEAVESIVFLPNKAVIPGGKKVGEKSAHAVVAGEGGLIKIWNISKSKEVFSQISTNLTKAFTQIMYNSKNNLLVTVNTDHNVNILDLETIETKKQLIGFSDEILDICFVGKKENYIAVATNSVDIKVYDTTNFDCRIISGHSDIVLTLASYNNFLLSAGKDNTIRLWTLCDKTFMRCLAIGSMHTASIGSIAFGRLSHTLCASVSQDTCLRMWKIPKSFESDEIVQLISIATQIAHPKDINCVTISPNDRIVATGSQDKTIKLWNSENLESIGLLKGHRRGVWSVRFSPVDQVLLSTSADCTMKLWSLTELNCLKSIEGHESSVLRAEFISNGMQIISSGADGLIKLWSIKTSECELTLEKHEDRIWALAVGNDEKTFYSGGADSLLVKWKDVTVEKRMKDQEDFQQRSLKEQELTNLVSQKKYVKALRLAINLDKPHLSLKIIKQIITEEQSYLQTAIDKLNVDQKRSLLAHANKWNTNTRHCGAAQLVMNILLKESMQCEAGELSKLSKIVEEMLPYTERHMNRLTEYLKEFNFILYTYNCMQPYNNTTKMDVE